MATYKLRGVRRRGRQARSPREWQRQRYGPGPIDLEAASAEQRNRTAYQESLRKAGLTGRGPSKAAIAQRQQQIEADWRYLQPGGQPAPAAAKPARQPYSRFEPGYRLRPVGGGYYFDPKTSQTVHEERFSPRTKAILQGRAKGVWGGVASTQVQGGPQSRFEPGYRLQPVGGGYYFDPQTQQTVHGDRLSPRKKAILRQQETEQPAGAAPGTPAPLQPGQPAPAAGVWPTTSHPGAGTRPLTSLEQYEAKQRILLEKGMASDKAKRRGNIEEARRKGAEYLTTLSANLDYFLPEEQRKKDLAMEASYNQLRGIMKKMTDSRAPNEALADAAKKIMEPYLRGASDYYTELDQRAKGIATGLAAMPKEEHEAALTNLQQADPAALAEFRRDYLLGVAGKKPPKPKKELTLVDWQTKQKAMKDYAMQRLEHLGSTEGGAFSMSTPPEEFTAYREMALEEWPSVRDELGAFGVPAERAWSAFKRAYTGNLGKFYNKAPLPSQPPAGEARGVPQPTTGVQPMPTEQPATTPRRVMTSQTLKRTRRYVGSELQEFYAGASTGDREKINWLLDEGKSEESILKAIGSKKGGSK